MDSYYRSFERTFTSLTVAGQRKVAPRADLPLTRGQEATGDQLGGEIVDRSRRREHAARDLTRPAARREGFKIEFSGIERGARFVDPLAGKPEVGNSVQNLTAARPTADRDGVDAIALDQRVKILEEAFNYLGASQSTQSQLHGNPAATSSGVYTP